MFIKKCQILSDLLKAYITYFLQMHLLVCSSGWERCSAEPLGCVWIDESKSFFDRPVLRSQKNWSGREWEKPMWCPAVGWEIPWILLNKWVGSWQGSLNWMVSSRRIHSSPYIDTHECDLLHLTIGFHEMSPLHAHRLVNIAEPTSHESGDCVQQK